MHRQRFMRSGLSWLHCVFLTFVLVTSFGSVTYLTWSQQIETEATLVDRRLPASLLEEVNASSQSRGQDYKVQDIHLGCLRDSSVSAIESRAKLVRLVAESCEGQKIQDLKIANRSSGLSATIFKLENQSTRVITYI